MSGKQRIGVRHRRGEQRVCEPGRMERGCDAWDSVGCWLVLLCGVLLCASHVIARGFVKSKTLRHRPDRCDDRGRRNREALCSSSYLAAHARTRSCQYSIRNGPPSCKASAHQLERTLPARMVAVWQLSLHHTASMTEAPVQGASMSRFETPLPWNPRYRLQSRDANQAREASIQPTSANLLEAVATCRANDFSERPKETQRWPTHASR